MEKSYLINVSNIFINAWLENIINRFKEFIKFSNGFNVIDVTCNLLTNYSNHKVSLVTSDFFSKNIIQLICKGLHFLFH